MLYNRLAQLELYKGEDNKYGESEYEEAVEIKCTRYGTKEYKREENENNVYADYIYQTKEKIKLKDRLDGYEVVKVNEHTDIFGKYVYMEVFVSNG